VFDRACFYHFVTHWEIPGNIQRAYDLISKPLDYPRWWKSVKLTVSRVQEGRDEPVQICLTGRIPYSLRWTLTGVSARAPFEIISKATGDLEGLGVWSFKAQGPVVHMTFDWQVQVRKPLLRWTSFAFKPLLIWNHHQVMNSWKESLKEAMKGN
jgi:hypothetical protein